MSGNTPSLPRLSPIRVLVTGGAGYIGSHTAKLLARSGFEPVVLDNLSTGHRWAVKWGPMIEGDLSDAGLIREVIGAYKVRAVIHFAASAYVGESMKSPRKYFRNNVANAPNLLVSLIDNGAAYRGFSSTCTTYELRQTVPVS